MLTPPAECAEAPVREGRHLAHAVLAHGFARSRAGEITGALSDLDQLRHQHWHELDALERAALLNVVIDCRLARGEIDRAAAEGAAREALSLTDRTSSPPTTVR